MFPCLCLSGPQPNCSALPPSDLSGPACTPYKILWHLIENELSPCLHYFQTFAAPFQHRDSSGGGAWARWVGGRWPRQGVPGGARTRRWLARVCGKRTQILQEIRSERTIADCLHDRMEASLFTVKFGLLNHTKKGQVKKL